MFLNHFNLDRHPFLLTPDPRFLFMSDRHRDAMAHMSYILQTNSGFLAMTGEVGTGKTTLCRAVLARLPAGVDVALILNPKLTVVELLQTICEELGMECPGSSQGAKALFDALNQHLLTKLDQGHRTVLIIDEAQGLSVELLEQLRLLTNLETYQEKLLQIILIGQPELETLLRRQELRQLAQRITAYFCIGPLRRVETIGYIRHRLNAAGWQGPDIFSSAACHWIHRFARGTPRVINRICERAMLMAYANHRRTVSGWMAVTSSMECLLPLAPRWVWTALLGSGAYGLLILVMLGVGIWIATTDATISRIAGSWSSLVARQTSDAPIRPGGASTSIPVKPVLNPSTAPENALPQPVSKSPVEKKEQGQDAIQVEPGQMASLAESVSLTHTPADTSQPAHPTLEEVLANASSSSASAFNHLLALWGHPKVSAEGCDQVRVPGLTCYTMGGSWSTLQSLNRPVVLSLRHPVHASAHALLTGLTRDSATLLLENGMQTLTIASLEKVWSGEFAVVSRMPPGMISHKGKGDDEIKITWLRERLSTLQWHAPPVKKPGMYDEGLRKRLIGFQRQHRLDGDGLLGPQTLVALFATPLDPQGPHLKQKLPLPMLLQSEWDGASVAMAYKALLGLWGVTPDMLPTREWCEHAQRFSLECTHIRGSWSLLKRLDLPAILILTSPDGGTSHAVVEKLKDQRVDLRFGHWSGSFSKEEIESFWGGRMVVMGKSPPNQRKVMQLGDQGEEVLWLRRRLEAIQGPGEPVADPALFDQGLRSELIAFQKKQSIQEDGIAKGLTLMLLQSAMRDNLSPSLSKAHSSLPPGIHGGR